MYTGSLLLELALWPHSWQAGHAGNQPLPRKQPLIIDICSIIRRKVWDGGLNIGVVGINTTPSLPRAEITLRNLYHTDWEFPRVSKLQLPSVLTGFIS